MPMGITSSRTGLKSTCLIR